MLGNKRWTIAATFVVIATILSLTACAAPTPQVVEKEVVVEKPVVETVVVEKEVVVEKPVVETVVVEKELIVTPTPMAIKPATIRVSMTQVGSRIPFWENLVKTFMDKYPHIKVKMEGAPPEEFYLKLLAQFAAGDPPDIMQLELDKFPSFAERGVLMNLGPLMEKHNFDAEAFFAEDLARSTYQGEQVLIPDNVEAGALTFNQQLFDEAGVDYPDENTTVEEWVEMARKLTRDIDGDGVIDVYGWQIYPTLYWFDWHFWVQDANILNEDGTKCLIDTPEGIKAWGWLIGLYTEEKVSPPPDVNLFGFFFQSRVAMSGFSPHSVSAINQQLADPWDIAFLPEGPGGRFAPLGGSGWSISVSTKEPDAAWIFVDFITGEVAQLAMVKEGVNFPTRKALVHLMVDPEKPPESDWVYAENKVEYGRMIDIPVRNAAQVNKVMQDEFDRMTRGAAGGDIEESAKRMCAEIDRLLSEE